MERSSAARWLAAAALVGVGTLLPRAAHAWCRTTTDDTFIPTAVRPCADSGIPLQWASKCVGYDVQRDGSSAQAISLDTSRAIVGQAFANWANADCPADPVSCDPTDHTGRNPSVSATDLGPVDCDQAEYNQKSGNANIIMFHDSWPDEKGDPETTLALTTVVFDKGSGEIYDADIEINSDPRYNKPPLGITTGDTNVGYDLASILQHETGHFLGLAHTQPANTSAVMYAQYKQGATFMRNLSPDDGCGICAAYDPRRNTTCNTTPRRGLALGCFGSDMPDTAKGCHCDVAGGGGGGTWALCAAALALTLGAARRARSAGRRR
jgi:hypothetical protein